MKLLPLQNSPHQRHPHRPDHSPRFHPADIHARRRRIPRLIAAVPYNLVRSRLPVPVFEQPHPPPEGVVHDQPDRSRVIEDIQYRRGGIERVRPIRKKLEDFRNLRVVVFTGHRGGS